MPDPAAEQHAATQPGGAAPAPRGKFQEIWPELRKLLVFQVKLYVDAVRDLLMSPLSVVIFIADQVQGNRGEDALFESLLQFGRRTEKAINLFNQHDPVAENIRGVDSILEQVENTVRKEFKDGSVSETARDTIEKSLGRLRSKLQESTAATKGGPEDQ